jgi:hypothetical protein
MSLRGKKQSALEASIDQARNAHDWNLALSQTKKLAKQLGSAKLPLEDIITAESLLEANPSQAKTILLSIVEKEPENEVRYAKRNDLDHISQNLR